MRACVRREWRLGDDRGATADAVELAEWTINYIAADPALPLQNVDRLNAREGGRPVPSAKPPPAEPSTTSPSEGGSWTVRTVSFRPSKQTTSFLLFFTAEWCITDLVLIGDSRAITGKPNLPVHSKPPDGVGKNAMCTGNTGSYRFIAYAREVRYFVYIIW